MQRYAHGMRAVMRICAPKGKGPYLGLRSFGGPMPEKILLTKEEVADLLDVRPRTVQVWARRGLIPTVRISAKVVRFDRDAVVAALRQRGGVAHG